MGPIGLDERITIGTILDHQNRIVRPSVAQNFHEGLAPFRYKISIHIRQAVDQVEAGIHLGHKVC